MLRAARAAILSLGLGPVTITGGPFVAKIGTPVSFGLTASGPVQLTSGAADLADVGLTLNTSTGAFSGTP